MLCCGQVRCTELNSTTTMAKRAAETKGGYPCFLNPFTTGRSGAWRSASATPGRVDQGKRDHRDFSGSAGAMSVACCLAPRHQEVIYRWGRTRSLSGGRRGHFTSVEYAAACSPICAPPCSACPPPVRGYTFASKFHFFFRPDLERASVCACAGARESGKGRSCHCSLLFFSL